MIHEIYRFHAHSDFVTASFLRENDSEQFVELFWRKRSKITLSQPIPLAISSPPFRGEHTIADFVEFGALGPLIMLSKYALQYLLPMIREDVTVLGATLDKQSTHDILVCETSVDAMIPERSTPKLGSDGLPYVWLDVEIDPNKVGDRVMFRLDHTAYAIYVTDRFVKTCEENDLIGFNFDLVWTAKAGKVHQTKMETSMEGLRTRAREAETKRVNYPALHAHARKILRERQSASVHSLTTTRSDT